MGSDAGMDSIGLSEIIPPIEMLVGAAGIHPRYLFYSYNGFADHKPFLIRLENFLLYSSFQRFQNRSIWSVLPGYDSFGSCTMTIS